MTQTLPPPATVASLCSPVVAQLMLNQLPTTSTGSVKLTVILASRGALMPFLRGSLLNTFGPSSTIGSVRRGFGVAALKSVELLSVSVAPLFVRKREVVEFGAGAL